MSAPLSELFGGDHLISQCEHFGGVMRLTFIRRQARKGLYRPSAPHVGVPRLSWPVGIREERAAAKLDHAVTRVECHDL